MADRSANAAEAITQASPAKPPSNRCAHPKPMRSVSPGSHRPGLDPGGTSWMGLWGCCVPESPWGPYLLLVPLEPSPPTPCSTPALILQQNAMQKAN